MPKGYGLEAYGNFPYGDGPYESNVVLLDDGTGTYPYDVTSYVRGVEGITWNRGRQDELSDNQAGALSLTFDNTDGRFTLGDPTYNVACDQAIRWQVNGTPRWTGKVQSWPVSWPDGSDQFAVVSATATDELAPLTRRKLYSAVVEEIAADLGTTAALWPLSDDPGDQLLPQQHDVQGVGPALMQAITTMDGSGPIAQFGQSLGTPDGANGVLLTSATTLAAPGRGLMPVPTKEWLAPGIFTSLHFEITYNLSQVFTDPSDIVDLLFSSDMVALVTLTNGNLNVRRSSTDSTRVIPVSGYSGLHTVVVDCNNTTAQVWFDGTLIDSWTGVAANYNFSDANWRVGNVFVSANARTMAIGNVTIGPSLSSATRIVAHQHAALTDLAGETPAARITRLAGYVGVPVGSIDATGDTTCGTANQVGRTAMDCIAETSDADQGNAYVDATGDLVYVSGETFAGLVDATLDANWFDEGTTFIVDMQNVVNYATGQGGVGQAIVGPAFDTASITAHGRYEQQYQWNVNSDDQALRRCQWKVANYAEPTPRAPSLTVDLLSMDSTNRATALAVDVNTFLQVTGLPSQTPGGTSVGFIVVGIQETISDTEWTLTLNCVLRTLAGAWVLGDTTYGVLGTTTKLYV